MFHTNEGHAGYLGLERIRELQDAEGLDFDEALAVVRAGTVFTTHTPVPAGIDRFPLDMVRHYFDDSAKAQALLPGVPTDRVLALGAEDNPSMFNMAHMGLRLAQRANGVSKLHGAVSRGMFGGLWSGFDTVEVPIGSVTNGVHGQTWEAREVTALIGPPAPHPAAHDGEAPSDAVLWDLRTTLRARLVGEVRRRVREAWLQRGASVPELSWTEHIFDPDVLTVGFARRVPTYKRLTLMLRDPDRLRDMLLDPHRPVQLVVAGKAHPADDGGKALIQQIVRFADDPAVRHRIVFLPDYDMSMARYLYWGCDVWLNNPLRPLEACGTSGMKSALNGGLNLSIRDGWWDELLRRRQRLGDPHRGRRRRPRTGATTSRRTRSTSCSPRRWRRVLRPRRDGVPQPLGGAGAPHADARCGRGCRPRGWCASTPRTGTCPPPARPGGSRRRTSRRPASSRRSGRGSNAAWPKVEVLGVDASGLPDTPVVGAPMTVRAVGGAGGAAPGGRRGGGGRRAGGRGGRAQRGRDGADEARGRVGRRRWTRAAERFEAAVQLPHAGLTGYTVRVLPSNPLLASSVELGKVVLAG